MIPSKRCVVLWDYVIHIVAAMYVVEQLFSHLFKIFV